MEIATLQQIISQEGRAAGGVGNSPANTFISEGPQTGNNPLTIPVITAESSRGSSLANTWTTQHGVYVNLNSKNSMNPMVHFLLKGRMDNNENVGRAPELMFHHRYGGTDCNSVLVTSVNTSYLPFYCSLHFVRNPTSSAISFSYTNYTSSYWQSGYDGAGAAVLTPNATTYAGVTDFSYSNKYSYSGSTSDYQGTISHTVQPGETIAIVTAGTFYYWTNFSNGAHLTKTFNPRYNNLYTSGLVPDYKLYAAHHQLRDRDTVSSTPSTGLSGLASIYNMAGAAFGENE